LRLNESFSIFVERIAETGADRKCGPDVDVAHEWRFAQALHHRVVVHQDRGLAVADRGALTGSRAGLPRRRP
jgi:hypothetical protein